jgi:ABC-type multidrug transport system fused ATPase/permease subunit
MVCITAKYVTAVMPFTLAVVYIIQKGYLRTSRQLRHLDLEAKAPVYSLFVETLNGLATIRSFGWQENLRKRNQILLDAAQKPFYLLYCIQRWLQLVLDMLLTVLSILVVVFALKFRSETSGGSTGVALVNVLTCGQHLVLFVQRWTLLETSIGAVSRVRAFSLQTPLETRQDSALELSTWRPKGSIEIDNISCSYRQVIIHS